MCQLAPKVGLHLDGVVFGSDDFCASIGTYYTLSLIFLLLDIINLIFQITVREM